MKYEYIFKESKSKEEFVKKVVKNFKVKKNTAARRWYEYNIKFNKTNQINVDENLVEQLDKDLSKDFEEQIKKLIHQEYNLLINQSDIKIEKPSGKVYNYLPDEKQEPSYRQKLLFDDLKKYLQKQNKQYYIKNGITIQEFNWFEDEGML